MKRGKSVASGLELPQPAPEKQVETESPTKLTAPSALRPSDSCSAGLDSNKEKAVIAPEAAQRIDNFTKKDIKKENDEKIKGMIAQSSQLSATKGAPGLRFALKSEASSWMTTKVAMPAQNRLNIEPANSSQISQHQNHSQTTEGQTVAKKTLSINLKSRTSQLSRSRLETSEDKQSKLEAFVNHVTSGKNVNAQEDSDESEGETHQTLGTKKNIKKLGSLLSPAPLSGKARLNGSSAQVNSLVRGEARHRSYAESSLEVDTTDQQELSDKPMGMQRSAGTQGEVQQASIPAGGVPVVLSRNKPRTASLTLGKSMLPKPPSLSRG
jgi:hypothetical protein